MINLKKNISYLVVTYIIVTFFYGIIIKFTFKTNMLFKFKTILPEVILSIIILLSLICILKSKRRLRNKWLFIFIIYSFVIIIINLFTRPSASEIAYVIRDVILPIITLYVLYNVDFTNQELKFILDKILIIMILFTILGFILMLLQHLLGWEWTSSFYTGYTFYGLDEASRIKVWFSKGDIIRPPSLTGNSGSNGIYNVISLIFIQQLIDKKRYKYPMVVLSCICTIMSTNKTAIVTLVIILVINKLSKLNKILKINYIIITSIILTIILIPIISNEDIIYSTLDRFNLWSENIVNIKAINFIIPINLFNTTAVSNTGFLSVLDSSYLYFLLSFGIIGLILLVCNLIALYITKSNNSCIPRYLILLFLLSSLMLNVTQGRGYFSIMCLLVPIFYNKKEKCY